MRKLTEGENTFSIALDYNLSGVDTLTFDFYYTYGDLKDSIEGDVLSYNCFNGVTSIMLDLIDIEDGEYVVSVSNGEDVVYSGLFNVYSYTLSSEEHGIVIGE